MFTVAELMPRLTERVRLSSYQAHRLVSGIPDRLSCRCCAILCDVLDSTPSDLITTAAKNLPARRAAGEEPRSTWPLGEPTRVRLTPEG
ncbi:XRE family transcriptional regulator [Streptomyces sp. NPDC059851]|uniref:XRE family transcriptional regulator n=1 Tax=Streptomyces sp. NPDC059851 TaxID=3346971 RepID=UPI00365A516C